MVTILDGQRIGLQDYGDLDPDYMAPCFEDFDLFCPNDEPVSTLEIEFDFPVSIVASTVREHDIENGDIGYAYFQSGGDYFGIVGQVAAPAEQGAQQVSVAVPADVPFFPGIGVLFGDDDTEYTATDYTDGVVSLSAGLEQAVVSGDSVEGRYYAMRRIKFFEGHEESFGQEVFGSQTMCPGCKLVIHYVHADPYHSPKTIIVRLHYYYGRVKY